MMEMSTNSPKTLLVFKKEHENRIIPHIQKLLTGKKSTRTIDGKIYAAVNSSKYHLDFKGIELCDVIGG